MQNLKTYLKLSTTDGDSTDVGRAGWFDVLSFNFIDSRVRAGTSSSSFTIVVRVGKSSGELRRMYTAGTPIPKAVLEMVSKKDKSDPNRTGEIITFTFEGLYVSDCQTGGNPPADVLSLDYSKVISNYFLPGGSAQFVRPQDRGLMAAASPGANRSAARTAVT